MSFATDDRPPQIGPEPTAAEGSTPVVSPWEVQMCEYILTVSAGLAGACLALVGLFRTIETLRNLSGIGDNLLALDALVLLVASILSYTAMRSRTPLRARTFARVADAIFLLGMLLLAVVSGMIAWELI